MDVYVHSFLTSPVGGREWSALQLHLLYHRESFFGRSLEGQLVAALSVRSWVPLCVVRQVIYFHAISYKVCV